MDFFTGQIIPMATTYAPKQTALCNGQMLPVNQNQALFTLLGIAFGGNGQPGGNFGLPNAQGRSMQGFGKGGSTMPLGSVGGESSHTLLIGEMPQHLHTVMATTQGAQTDDPTGALPGSASTAIYGPAPQLPAAPTPLGGAPLATVGANQAHNNMQPSLAISYTIVLYGVYPTRS